MYRFSFKNYVGYYLIAVNIVYLLLFLIFPEYLAEGYPSINVFNYITANLFGIIVIWCSSNYTIEKGYLVFIYVVVFIFITKFFFLHITGKPFEFSADDSMDYHLLAKDMSQLPFYKSLGLLKNTYGIDDWGFPFILQMLYRVFESPFTLMGFNIFCIFFAVKMLRKMGQAFMSRRAANMAALLFGCSQYVIFYSASGLKEIIMVTICISSFYFYFKYLQFGKIAYLWLTLAITILLVFFRVPLVLFIFIAIMFNQIYRSNTKFKYIYLIIFALFSFIAIWVVSDLLFRYAQLVQNVGNVQNNQFSGPAAFTYSVALLSGIIGPFPTFVPIEGYTNNSFYAGSLLFKVLISPYFIIGTFWVINNRNKYILPLVIFVLCEIASLIYILEAFEFRKSLPHIPFVILIAIYTLENLKLGKHAKAFLKYGSILGLIVLVLMWNLLRLK